MAARKFRLRIEPYNPDAFDADNDGIVQEGTAWERPAGTRIVNAAGREIARNLTSEQRTGFFVIDAAGQRVSYVPTYERGDLAGGQKRTLSDRLQTLGDRYGTLGSKVRSVKDTVNPPEPEQLSPEEQEKASLVKVGETDEIFPWENGYEIADLETLGYSTSDEEGMTETEIRDSRAEFFDEKLREIIESDWAQWDPCREIRRAAYEIAGLEDSPLDINLRRTKGFFGNGWVTAATENQRVAQAMLLMADLADQRKNKGGGGVRQRVFRALTTNGNEDEFLRTARKGAVVDIPLLSAADKETFGDEHYLSRYGDEILMEFDVNSGIEGGIITAAYTKEDEENTIDDIRNLYVAGTREQIQELKDEVSSLDQSDPEWEDLQDRIGYLEQEVEEVEDFLESLESKTGDQDARSYLISQIENITSDYFEGSDNFFRWAGVEIPEEDSSFFYDAFEDGSMNSAREIVIGGRFEVLDVIEDETGAPYSHRVILRQVGVFDPVNKGSIVGQEPLSSALR